MDFEVVTLGHSDRAVADVVALLRAHDVRHLVDVRRFPGSRTHPQWGQEALEAALPDDLDYHWIVELGGRRHTPAGVESPNGWWRVKAFQSYADHMSSPEFAAGLARLRELAAEGPTAIMCSEAVPWRCHRRLITDALLVAGVRVGHVISATRTEPAGLNEHARVRDGHLLYPP